MIDALEDALQLLSRDLFYCIDKGDLYNNVFAIKEREWNSLSPQFIGCKTASQQVVLIAVKITQQNEMVYLWSIWCCSKMLITDNNMFRVCGLVYIYNLHRNKHLVLWRHIRGSRWWQDSFKKKVFWWQNMRCVGMIKRLNVGGGEETPAQLPQINLSMVWIFKEYFFYFRKRNELDINRSCWHRSWEASIKVQGGQLSLSTGWSWGSVVPTGHAFKQCQCQVAGRQHSPWTGHPSLAFSRSTGH